MNKQAHEIVINVDPDGQVTFTVKGIGGTGCQGLAKALAEAMGGEVSDTGHTAEHRMRPQVNTQQRTGRR